MESLEYNLLSGERKIIAWAKNHELDFEEFVVENYDPFFNINYEEDLIVAKEIEENLLQYKKHKFIFFFTPCILFGIVKNIFIT